MADFVSVFFLVGLVNLGGRGGFVSAVVAGKHASPWYVFAGVVLGYAAIAAISVLLGGFASLLIPFPVVKWVCATTILLVGLLTAFTRRPKDDCKRKCRLAGRMMVHTLRMADESGAKTDAGRMGSVFFFFLVTLSTEIAGRGSLMTLAVAATYQGGLLVFLGSLAGMVVSRSPFVFWQKGTFAASRLIIVRGLTAVVCFAVAISIFLTSPENLTEARDEKASVHGVISNFRKINDRLYAGARPGEKGVEELARMGIKAILNLESGVFDRQPKEVEQERRLAEKHGIRFYAIPMHPLSAPRREDVDKALRLIADPQNQPVFVHCHEGKDRTGVVIAAYRVRVDGWSRERAYEEMKKYGFHRALFWWKRSFSRGSEPPLFPFLDGTLGIQSGVVFLSREPQRSSKALALVVCGPVP